MARVWVGTSGFSYKEWKGLFYPPDLPDKQMLSYYATRFSSVEIDSTFYRMPTSKTLEAWLANAPENFRFVLKAPQQITHRRRLQVPSDALTYFTSAAMTLKDRLGFVAYQLPPFFKCDLPRLQAFLEALPDNSPSSFEFRHPSWFNPEVFGLLKRHNVILCIHDTDEGCSPHEVTAGAIYVRLRRSSYAPQQREEWRVRWRTWAESGLEVFAYVKHKDNPEAPLIALEFAKGF